MKKLRKKELYRIKDICTQIELTEYKQGGWKYLSGGFCRCDMIDYDADEIYLELVSGCQNDYEDRVYTSEIVIDRKTMNYLNI